MSITVMWKFIVILNLHLLLGNAYYINGPRNMVVSVGQRVEMECRADINSTISEWSMQRPFTSNKKTIFTKWKKIINPHFGVVEGINGSIMIHINSTQMDDAGIYTCAVQKELRQPDKLSAQLIVFETEPLCETNLSNSENNTFEEGTHLWMRCTVNFTGSWAPTLEWRLHESNGETEETRDLTDWANVEIVPNVNISSTLTIAPNAKSKSFYYSCKIYFTTVFRNQTHQVVTANNTPDYNYTWKSPLLTTLPKIIILPTTQLIQMATEDSTETEKDLTPTFSAIYLVAGIAILFGITGSMIAIILCLHLRRKNAALMAQKNSATVEASEYDLIPYAITDGYDTIEEVDEKDDILFPNSPPRHGPLPTPGYAALMPDEPKPPGVYSRMDHKEKSVDDQESDVDRNNLQSDIDRSNTDHSNLPAVEETAMKTAMPVNSYLVLEPDINIIEDIATKGEKITSANSLVANNCLQSNTNNNVQDTIQEYDIPSSYLTTREIDSSEVQK